MPTPAPLRPQPEPSFSMLGWAYNEEENIAA